MTGRLSGLRVLVPALSGERLGAALRAEGAITTVAPAISVTEENTPELSTALERLSNGSYDWLGVTSAALVPLLPPVSSGTRIAAVGTATADALRAAGHRVDFTPQGEHSAAGMVAEWPRWGATVLLPLSSIAAPTLADGLRARGFAVDTVTAYRNHPRDLPAEVIAGAASGAFDAVVLTSGSIAKSLAQQISLDGLRVVCIGHPSADAARELGITVSAVAARPEPGAIIDALTPPGDS